MNKKLAELLSQLPDLLKDLGPESKEPADDLMANPDATPEDQAKHQAVLIILSGKKPEPEDEEEEHEA